MTSQSERTGHLVKTARKLAGFTQQQLAHEAGVSVATVARLEAGRTEYPRGEEFERVATALGTTTDALRGLVDNASSSVAPVETAPTAPRPTDDRSAVRRNLEARYGADAVFVEEVLDRLETQAPPQRTTILRLLLGGIGDTLGRPPLTRDLQLSR